MIRRLEGIAFSLSVARPLFGLDDHVNITVYSAAENVRMMTSRGNSNNHN